MSKTYTKRIGYVNKKPELSFDEFVSHWKGVHAVLCQRIPGLKRYAINVIDRRVYPQMPFDGFSELWFDSVEAHDAAFASPEGVELLADAKNFTEKLTGVLVAEQRFIWPDHDEFEG